MREERTEGGPLAQKLGMSRAPLIIGGHWQSLGGPTPGKPIIGTTPRQSGKTGPGTPKQTEGRLRAWERRPNVLWSSVLPCTEKWVGVFQKNEETRGSTHPGSPPGGSLTHMSIGVDWPLWPLGGGGPGGQLAQGTASPCQGHPSSKQGIALAWFREALLAASARHLEALAVCKASKSAAPAPGRANEPLAAPGQVGEPLLLPVNQGPRHELGNHHSHQLL